MKEETPTPPEMISEENAIKYNASKEDLVEAKPIPFLSKEERRAQMIKIVQDVPRFDPQIPPGFPIPVKNMIFVEPLEADETITSVGIILPKGMKAKNSIMPNTGIIAAIGFDCEDYLFPGQHVLFNPICLDYTRIFFNNKYYLYLHSANDIFAVLPPSAWVHRGTKDDDWQRREEMRESEENYLVRRAAKDENEKDEQSEERKQRNNPSKTFIIRTGKGGNA